MNKVMYVVINQDLDMSSGKIGAHVGHAVFDYCFNENKNIYHEETEDYIDEWVESEILSKILKYMKEFKNNGDTIIVLKAHEKDLLKWEQEGYTAVRDRGYTEVAPNSITAVNLGIYDKDDDIPKWIQRLRLL